MNEARPWSGNGPQEGRCSRQKARVFAISRASGTPLDPHCVLFAQGFSAQGGARSQHGAFDRAGFQRIAFFPPWVVGLSRATECWQNRKRMFPIHNNSFDFYRAHKKNGRIKGIKNSGTNVICL